MQWEECSRWRQCWCSTGRAGRSGSQGTAALAEVAVGARSLRRAGTAGEGGRYPREHSLQTLATQKETGTGGWHGRQLMPLPPCHSGRRDMLRCWCPQLGVPGAAAHCPWGQGLGRE